MLVAFVFGVLFEPVSLQVVTYGEDGFLCRRYVRFEFVLSMKTVVSILTVMFQVFDKSKWVTDDDQSQ